jgi:hypothetical protein
MTKRLWLLCAVVILLLPIVGHAQPCTGDDCALLSAVGVATVKPTGPAAKVSSAIRQALSQPEQRGQGLTTSELQGGGLSTDAARMNRAGEVQVYVVTSLVDSQNSGDLPFVEVLKAGRIGRQ